MELSTNTIKYPLALLVGLLLGWMIQPWFGKVSGETSAAESAMRTANKATISSKDVSSTPPLRDTTQNVQEDALDSPAEALDIEELDSSLLLGRPEPNNALALDTADLTGLELLNHIGSWEDEVFWDQLNSGDLRLLLRKFPRLIDELMSNVLDLQDKALSRRLLYLFENMNSHYSSDEVDASFPVEKWVLQKLKSEERAAEWLSFLSKVGVHSKDSFLYLGNRLRDYAIPDETQHILSILARKSYSFNGSMNADEIKQIDQIIEPFFSSDNHVERMFAVASLTNTPFEQSESKLRIAMSDESRRVRMSAMRVIRDNEFSSAEISTSLMTSLGDKSLSAYERLGAYEVLSRVKLNQDQYEAVYHFAENERVALEKEFNAERQAAQKQGQ